MKTEAVEAARRRLQRATRAATELKSAKSFDEAEDAWIDFLVASAAVFSKLEQGSKESELSRDWFATVKHERKTDLLLNYLHRARNTDQHGITPVSVRKSDNRHLPFGSRDVGQVQRVDKETGKPTGEPIAAAIIGPHLAVRPVFDGRAKAWVEVPGEHDGDKLEHFFCADILADTALRYLERLVERAAELDEG